MSVFELFKNKQNQKTYFRLKTNNGQILLDSKGYNSFSLAKQAITQCKNNCLDNGKFERKTSTNGKFHFVLKGNQNEIIAVSQAYNSEAGMQNAIQSVKKNAAIAIITTL